MSLTRSSSYMNYLLAPSIVFALFSATQVIAQEASEPQAGEGSKATQAEDWIQLFNGKDLSGWIPKIRYHELGENYGNTFRVEDGLLKVRYEPEQYPTFDERFGHLFFEKPFAHYRLRVEYRFVGEQCAGGPGWAVRNSGMMLHGEDPKWMAVDQDFPHHRQSVYARDQRHQRRQAVSAPLHKLEVEDFRRRAMGHDGSRGAWCGCY